LSKRGGGLPAIAGQCETTGKRRPPTTRCPEKFLKNQAGHANSITSPDALFLAYSNQANKIQDTISGSFFPPLYAHRSGTPGKQYSSTSLGPVTPPQVFHWSINLSFECHQQWMTASIINSSDALFIAQAIWQRNFYHRLIAVFSGFFPHHPAPVKNVGAIENKINDP
tara:strand:- start:4060 stop:4563 length:504 start_codon:yes stop_codon:yes gene_type:complete